MSEQQPITPPPAEGEMTDEELLRAYGKARRDYCHDGPSDDWPKRAERAATIAGLRAVEAAVIARRPAPAPPADGEVAELVAEIRHFLAGYQQMRGLDPEHIYSIHRGDKMEAHITVSRLTRAAELLQRQVLVPVSVSERLPEPSECAPWPKDSDASAWCWMGQKVDGGWEWEQRSAGYLGAFPGDFTHWLPAHALPLPSGEGNNG